MQRVPTISYESTHIICINIIMFCFIPASITPLQAVPRFPPPPRRVVQQQVPVICRDGWTPAVAENLDGGPSAICIQTNRKSLPWKQSRDICRSNDAFLLKLDRRVRIGSQTLEEFITDQSTWLKIKKPYKLQKRKEYFVS